MGDEPLYLRGVTYGTFAPSDGHGDYPPPERVEADFGLMAASGINSVRTYTVPPRWMLDLAHHHDLRVLVGLPWEQHVAFLKERERRRSIEERVRAGVRTCAEHPAVLGYAVGNEIPAPIVRWHGRHRVAAFLRQLFEGAKEEDAEALVTYVNYPTTEYLELPFLDFACFNVYLEARETLEAYLARLHNLVGELPLVMAEIGLDSRRNGEAKQAEVLEWQVETAFASGCAGAYVFSWTDEWHRGGYEIEDWDFGLTDRGRRPKPALPAVSAAFAAAPFPEERRWPRVSVVVCTHNGERTLPDCFEGLHALRYPDYEVIVVDDGSTDATPVLAEASGFRVIRTENCGLANARNTGLGAATGEIVAYVDDDARPHPDWLRHLSPAVIDGPHAGAGGPNIPPGEDGAIAECVANAPGGPIHVLLSDRVAEHIPGCNMAFRKADLEAIGGFDPRFRAAGDDVDLCWRLQQAGRTLGFSPAAMVWHHRRNSVRAYWRQQRGYGRAEGLLEAKWPEHYNAAGHLRWSGRLYGRGLSHGLGWQRRRVHYGTWGSRLFQSVYEPARGGLASLPLMPEWYLLIAALSVVSALGALWEPLRLALPALGLACGGLLTHAALGAANASFAGPARSPLQRVGQRALTCALFVLQPLARLLGRIGQGLTPWRRRGLDRLALPLPRTLTAWSEQWRAQEEWVGQIEAELLAARATASRGGDCDRWELQVRGGTLGAARFRAAVEEHGSGRQLLRLRVWPRPSPGPLVLIGLFTALSVAAALDGAVAASVLLGLIAAAAVGRATLECAAAVAAFEQVCMAEPLGAHRASATRPSRQPSP